MKWTEARESKIGDLFVVIDTDRAKYNDQFTLGDVVRLELFDAVCGYKYRAVRDPYLFYYLEPAQVRKYNKMGDQLAVI